MVERVCDEPDLPTLKSVEMRVEPEDTTEIGRRADRTGQLATDLELGWTLHFIRDRDAHLGYHRTYRHLNHAALSIERALQAKPERLQWLRGLDLASDERAGPLWVAAPLIARARQASRIASQHSGLPAMRVTLHVGEDFDHLASGLRAVHEPLLWQLVEPGDRLGHALALAMPPEDWCRRNPLVPMTRHARLLDLAWMLGLMEQAEPNLRGQAWQGVAADTEPRLRAALRQTLRDLDLPVETEVTRFHRDLGQRKSHEPWSHASGGAAEIDEAFRRHFSKPNESLNAIIKVDTRDDAPLLTAVAARVRREVARMQLAVEVNPSSNFVVGALDRPLDQPMFQLHPVNDQDGSALPVTLHSDDPLTFATCLADEYAYAWAGLVVSGNVSHALARTWLDDAASASWRWRFTLERPRQQNP